MSYTYQQNHDGSGHYRDNTSGKVFEHAGGKRAAESKRNSKQALLQDQATMRRAAESRPKAPQPMIRGVVVSPEIARITKPRSEKQVEHIGRESVSAGAGADNRRAFHERALATAKNDAERGQAMRRLAAMDTAKGRGEARQARRDAIEAQRNDPQLADAVSRAESIYQDLLARSDVNQLFVDEARKSLYELRHSKDFAAYAERERQLQQRFEFDTATKVATANATLAVTKQEIRGLKATPDIIPETEASNGPTE